MTEWLPYDDPDPEQSLLALARKSFESLLLSLTAADVPFVTPPLATDPRSQIPAWDRIDEDDADPLFEEHTP